MCTGWQAGWLAGWLAGRLASWLADWQAGRLAGWQAGWLAGWLAEAVLAGGKGSRRRNQKLMMNIVGFFSRYTYHSLLVVQGSISIAYWSSQPSVPQHTTTPPRAAPPLALCVPSRAGRFWER